MGERPVQRFLDEMDLLVRARYPVLYVVTFEEGRLEQLLLALARRQGKRLHTWTRSRGLEESRGHRAATSGSPSQTEPLEVLAAIERAEEPGLFLLKDFHRFLEDPTVVRRLRDLAVDLKDTYKSVVLSAPTVELPAELEKELTILDLPLPGHDDLMELLRAVCNELHQEDDDAVDLKRRDAEALVQAARGLTLSEAENAFARAAVTDGVLRAADVELVMNEKRQVIRKSGILEFHPSDASMNDVGGLEALKSWLRRRGKAFAPEAREFGLPSPRGVLLLGVPGCGKSLTARAVAHIWQLPLLHLDLGRVFSGLLGSSEENMRRALSVAEGVAPAVLWIDEMEKGLAGGASSGQSDGGTANRVFGTLLTWMQERQAPVFVVATANRIEGMPPELLRRGRFDEIFFVDLPEAPARAEVLGIHLRKRRRDPQKFDLPGLARLCEGFSGAELEHCVVEALFTAFDQEREVTSRDIADAIEATSPLSATSAEKIRELRQWAAARARPADDPAPPGVSG